MSKETIPQSIIEKINKEADDHAVIMSEGLNSHAFNMLKNTFSEAAIWGYGLDKWISVKDGFPEEGWYLCAKGEGMRQILITCHYSKKHKWETYGGEKPEPGITHYQYLPKPPKDI